MIRQLKPALLLTLLLTAVLGLGYPLVVTGAVGLLFPHESHGSLVEREGRIVGSSLVGQNFTSPRYFHPRPSATTDVDPNDAAKTIPSPYNAANSGGSNAAPTSRAYVDSVQAAAEALRAENPLSVGPIPADLVQASGSGLDPHISPAAAFWQIPRVAGARGVSEADVRRLVERTAGGRGLGIFGERTLNHPRNKLAQLNPRVDGPEKRRKSAIGPIS